MDWIKVICIFHTLSFLRTISSGDVDSFNDIITYDLPEAKISVPRATYDVGSEKIYFSLNDENELELICILSWPQLSHTEQKNSLEDMESRFHIESGSILWSKNGDHLQNSLSADQYVSHDDKLVLKLSGANKDSVEGDYACNITWPNLGSILSSTVSVRKIKNASKPSILLNGHDEEIRAEINSTAFIHCLLPDSIPEMTIVWFTKDYNDTDFIGIDADKKYMVTKRGLHLLVEEDSEGIYRCLSKNLADSQIVHSQPIKLSVSASLPNETSVSPISVIIPKQKQTEKLANIGENVSLECVMHGSPSPRLSWEKYGGLLDESKHVQILGNLILINVTKDDEGSYICRSHLHNDYDSNDNQPSPYIVYTLVVNEPIKARLSIKSSPTYEKAWQLSCDSVGGRVTDMILYRNGQVLLNGDVRPLHAKIDGGERPKWTLVFDKRTLSHGIYQCMVRNTRSSMPSYSHALYVEPQSTASSFSTLLNDKSEDDDNDESDSESSGMLNENELTPINDDFLPLIVQGPENATSFEHSPVTFVCQVQREEHVFWLKDNSPIKLGHRLRMIGTGTLEISHVTASDRGWYSCVAANVYGNSTHSAYLNVEQSPLPASGHRSRATSATNQNKAYSAPAAANQNAERATATNQNKQRRVDDVTRTRMNHRDVVNHVTTTIASDGKATKAKKKIWNVNFEAPRIYRMTNVSVLLTWSLNTAHLLLDRAQFFRIQYKLVSPHHHHAQVIINKWITLNDAVKPYLKAHVVDGLTPGTKYKFRVGAVFENNEISVSKSTPKFALTLNPDSPLPTYVPQLTEVKAMTSSSLKIAWTYPANDSSTVEGFVVMYRRLYAVNTASDPAVYQHDAVIGRTSRDMYYHHVIAHLLPALPYEVKIFAFNTAGCGPVSPARVQTTLTADGTFSPLSFLPALTANDRNVQKNGGANSADRPQIATIYKYSNHHHKTIFGFNHETVLVAFGCVVIFVLVFSIIGTIAWSITGKRKAKYRAVATSKQKFRDTSKRIFHEKSTLPRNLSSEKCAIANFYSYSPPSYESAVVKEQEKGNALPSLVPQVYSSNIAEDCSAALNLYSNLLNDGEDLSEFEQYFVEELEESPKSFTRSINGPSIRNNNCLDVTTKVMDHRRSGSLASYRSDRSKSVGLNSNGQRSTVTTATTKSMAGSFHGTGHCDLPDFNDHRLLKPVITPFNVTPIPGVNSRPQRLENLSHLCWTPRASNRSPAAANLPFVGCTGSVGDRRSWNLYSSSYSPTSPPSKNSAMWEFDEVRQFCTFKPDRSPKNKGALIPKNGYHLAHTSAATHNSVGSAIMNYSAPEPNKSSDSTSMANSGYSASSTNNSLSRRNVNVAATLNNKDFFLFVPPPNSYNNNNNYRKASLNSCNSSNVTNNYCGGSINSNSSKRIIDGYNSDA